MRRLSRYPDAGVARSSFRPTLRSNYVRRPALRGTTAATFRVLRSVRKARFRALRPEARAVGPARPIPFRSLRLPFRCGKPSLQNLEAFVEAFVRVFVGVDSSGGLPARLRFHEVGDYAEQFIDHDA